MKKPLLTCVILPAYRLFPKTNAFFQSIYIQFFSVNLCVRGNLREKVAKNERESEELMLAESAISNNNGWC